MSKQPVLLVFEYEIDDEVRGHFDAATDMLRQAIAALPPLAQPFNVTVFSGESADRVARAAFDRDCVPYRTSREERSGEAP